MGSEAEMPDRSIFRGCSAVVSPDLQLRRDLDIVVENGIIADIRPSEGLDDGFPAADLVAFPGLINCHTHLGDAAFADKGFGMEPQSLLWPPDGARHHWMAEANRSLLIDAMRMSARLMLASGTVAFADFREQGEPGVAALHDAVRDMPIEAVVLGRPATFPLHNDRELAENAGGLDERTLAEVTAILKGGDGFSLVWANDTTDMGLRQVRALCEEHNARLAIHAGATPRYRELSLARTGKSDVARVVEFLHPDFVVHMTAATPEEFAILAAAHTPVVMCARTQAALGQGIPPMTTALEQGATVALGTDNAMISSPDLLAELNFFSRALRGVTGDPLTPTPHQLLAAVTKDAARMLRVEDRLGWIDIGREATFFLLDMSTPNLRYSSDPITALVTRATSGDIRTVLVRGDVVSGSLR